MSHEVETMAYAGALPWHGLGNKVSDCVSVDEMLVAAGLDWEVEQFDVFAQIGTNGKPGSRRIPIKTQKALIRTSDDRILSTTGKNWKPLQNRDALGFFREFCEAGQATLETAGSLRGGKIVWALAKLHESFLVGKSDKVELYSLLVSPHEAGKGITGRSTGVRVVCANTMRLAMSAATSLSYSQSHLTEFDAEAAKKAIGLSHEEFSQYKLDAETLHNLEMSEYETVRLFAKHFSPGAINLKDTEAEQEKAIEKLVNEPQARSKVLNELLSSYETAPGAEVGTGWGALNAVTHWTDHVAGRTADARLYRSWFDTNGLRVNKVKDDLLELAS